MFLKEPREYLPEINKLILKLKTNHKKCCWKVKLKNDNSYELRY